MLRSVYLRKIQHSALVLFTGAALTLAGCGGDDPAPKLNVVNHAPEAHATASAAEVQVGTVVQLDASTSTDADSDALTFAWTLKAPDGSKAAVAKATDAKTSFTADVEGTYAITIAVSDGKGGVTQQSVSVKAVAAAKNTRPTANATASSSDVAVGTEVTFDGTKSADPDKDDKITFAWSITKQPATSKITLSSATAITPTATPDVVGDYELQLIVTDNHGAASDPVKVALKAHEKAAVNQKPTAMAETPSADVTVGQDVTVDGVKSSDPDKGDTITFAWTFTKVPAGSAAKFVNAATSKTTFNADKEGEFIAQLIVTDSHGAASDPKTVTVKATPALVNHVPTAKAEASAAKVRPAKAVTLDGSHSTDPDPGDKLTYAWALKSAPAQSKAAIAAADAVKASFAFTPDLEGDYQLDLVVTDSKGAASAPSSVVVTASNAVNLAPTALILPIGDVEVKASATLDGTGSTDPDNDKLTYAWAIVSAPHDSKAALTGADTAKAALVPDAIGQYNVSLVVTDDHGAASKAVTVTINAVVADGAPTAVAVAKPASIETGIVGALDATGSSDPENDPLSYTWRVVGAPAGSKVALSDAKAPKPTYTADLAGSYVFGLTANDGKKSSDEVTVKVDATAFSSAPTARIVPSQQQIRLGGAVSFDGSSSADAQHPKLTYAWTLKGPVGSTATLSAADGSKVDLKPDLKGFYIVDLVVNDGKKSSSDTRTTIEVKEADAAPTPVATISANAAEVGQKVTLDGSASSDPENEPLTYTWVVESHPDGSTAKIAKTSAARGTFTPDLIGQYVFTLTVADNAGNKSSAKVSLNVDAFNQEPTASAVAPAEAQLGSAVTLDGSASRDPENSPITYAWSLSSAPQGSAAALSSATAAKPTFAPDKIGRYDFVLIVSDGKKSSQPAYVSIEGVQTNLAPVVVAVASDNEVQLGKSVTLDSTGTYDPENDPITFAWTVNGPAGSTAKISDPTAAKPTFTFDKLGHYEFQLAVSDGKRTTTSGIVAVDAVAVNAAPTASAKGPTAPVAIGTDVTLDGSASHDPENATLTYQWTVIAVPQGSSAKLSDAAAKAPTFKADVAGDFVFQLVVSDGQNLSLPVTLTIKAK